MPNNSDDTGLGLVSIGNGRNPYLPFDGANIIAAAGLGSAGGLENSNLDFDSFISQFVNGGEGARYFSELTSSTTGTTVTQASFNSLSKAEQNRIALEMFYLVLRDAGRDHNLAGSSGFGTYAAATTAISTLFPGTYAGDISLTAREIKTKSGGDISIFAPGGKLTVGIDANGTQPLDQGILTEHGGSINIFTKGNVDLGTSRVFTLRGGDIMMFSSEGNIAAGASSKTVQSAPPTRVLIDPQSGDVKVDIAGLATGGCIGVLATVAGVPPGNVDLIAPLGVVDAGDAGIRATGNLTIAATAVLNASNIAVGGASTGTPAAVVVSAPNVGGITGAQNTAGQGANTASEMAKQARPPEQPPQESPSIITVEVLGYGGGEGEDEETRRKRRQPPAL